MFNDHPYGETFLLKKYENLFTFSENDMKHYKEYFLFYKVG